MSADIFYATGRRKTSSARVYLKSEISSEKFWSGFDNAVHELAPKNKELIQIREDLQKKIDDWHIKNKGKELNKKEYLDYLKSISYIVEEGKDFNIETKNLHD